MKKVRIVGVPEHFNLPWHMAIDEGAFAERGIDLQWTDVPEGTGKMCNMLQEGKTDLAVILTEGITKSIIEGNPCQIIQEYVASPLLWGIHVSVNSNLKRIESLQGTRAAISRYGSGSHLMAYVMAQNEGWETQSLKFEVVHNVEGAIKALRNKHADYFMWEQFTTKPLVDKGIFGRLGNCPTPWPCFVIAGHEGFIEKERTLINHVLAQINRYTTEFKRIPSIDRTLANTYGQKLQDIREWLSTTEWSQYQIKSHVLDNVINTLYNLKLISNKVDADELLTNL